MNQLHYLLASTGLTALAALTVGAPARAGELEARFVHEDARFVAHLDIEGLKRSTLWKLVREEHDLDQELGVDWSDLEAFKQQFGLDPFTDLHSVTLVCGGAELDEPTAILEVSDRIEAALARMQVEFGIETRYEQGVEVLSWRDGGESINAWLQAPKPGASTRRLVLAESLPDVVRTVQTIEGARPNVKNSKKPCLAVAPEAGTFLFVAVSGELPGLGGHDQASAVLDLARSLQLGAGESNGSLFARLTLETENERDARDVIDILQGAKAIAQLALRANDMPLEATLLLEALDIGGRGLTITVDFEYRTQDLFDDLRALTSAAERR